MEQKRLITEKEVDEFIKAEMINNGGWFNPECLHSIANPFKVMTRIDELGCWVHSYRYSAKPNLAVTSELVKDVLKNTLYGVQYNKSNSLDNYIQELFLSHFLNKQCYFSKIGENTVCFIHANKRTYKAFPGQYIFKKGFLNDFDVVILDQKEVDKLKRLD